MAHFNCVVFYFQKQLLTALVSQVETKHNARHSGEVKLAVNLRQQI